VDTDARSILAEKQSLLNLPSEKKRKKTKTQTNTKRQKSDLKIVQQDRKALEINDKTVCAKTFYRSKRRGKKERKKERKKLRSQQRHGSCGRRPKKKQKSELSSEE
jgi:hypothetical protein